MRYGDALDLVRVHVEAGYEDHVFLAILDEHETALIDAADITGSQHILPDHYLRSLVRTVPVTIHDLGAAHADLADDVDAELLAVVIADADFRGRDGQTDRPIEILARQVDARGR